MKQLKHLQILFCSLFLLTIIGCQKQPLASFTVSTNFISVGKAIMFTNTSVDADTYVWNFGDGSKSTEISPTHIYTISGTFSVTLTASSKNGEKKDIATTTIIVNNPSDVIFLNADNIIVDLGSTDANVVLDVKASNGEKVTVTGINYDEAGEHNATFTAGDATYDAVVKIKTDKLAGPYEFTWIIDGQADPTIYNSDIQQSTNVYNKILISDIIDRNISAVCTGTNFTIEETSLGTDGVTGTLTGTGTFVKDGENYKIATATLTIAWDDGITNVIELTFAKQ